MYNGSLQTNLAFTGKKIPRPKKKSCGYYMKLVFFFSSLIQSLIIVSLVLFLVYGQPEQTVEEKRVQDLENSYSRLSLENVALRAKEKNLTQVLNVTATAKKLMEKELIILRGLANSSTISIKALQLKWNQCEIDRRTAGNTGCPQVFCPRGNTFMDYRVQQTEEMLKLVRANFTEQMRITKLNLENANKAELRHRLEAIELRRDKASLQEHIKTYEQKCKEDFVHSLQGIPNVTEEFLKRVDELFSKHVSFQLTCEKQRSQLEDIRANCSSLSRELENKLQVYLDRVGNQVTTAVGASAKYMTENKRLKEDAAWCNGNRSAIVDKNQKTLKDMQLKYDQEQEQLLLQVTKLTANKNLQEELLSVKEIEIKMLSDHVKDLNASLASCKKNPFAFPGPPPFSHNRPPWDTRSATGGFGAPNTMGSLGPGFGGGMVVPGLGPNGQGTSLYGRTSGSSLGSNGMSLGSSVLGLPKPGPVNTLLAGAGGAGVGSTGPARSNPSWPSVGSTGTGMTGFGNTGSMMAGLGNTGSTLGSIGSGGTAAGKTGPGVGSAGTTTGLTSAGPSGTEVSSVGSSGSTLTRTGPGGAAGFGAFGSNPGGTSSFGGGRVPSGADLQLTAQINNHLRELHRYAKPN